MGEHFARRGDSGIYYARLRVPADLVETVGRKELTKSLCTTDRREAKRLTREWVDRQEREFGRLRRTRELTETDLKAIAVEHYVSELEFEERMKALKPSLVGLKMTPPASPVQSRPEEIELDRMIRGTNEPFDVPDPRFGRKWEADDRRVRLAALQEHIAQDNFVLIEWAVDDFKPPVLPDESACHPHAAQPPPLTSWLLSPFAGSGELSRAGDLPARPRSQKAALCSLAVICAAAQEARRSRLYVVQRCYPGCLCVQDRV